MAKGIKEDNSVYFSLRDSGSGIPAENLAQIFHGFFTTKENGLGIGLAICHSIVAAHGGSIVAANRPEGGAAFPVTLPCSVPAALLSHEPHHWPHDLQSTRLNNVPTIAYGLRPLH